jgi:Integral membrane protein DUF125.
MEAVHERVFRTLELGYSAEFVYGISDGLVEVLAAVSGLSGAISSAQLVALGGLIIGGLGKPVHGHRGFLSTKVEEEGKEIGEEDSGAREEARPKGGGEEA